MQDKVPLIDVRCLVNMIDALGVKQRRAALNTMNNIATLEQQLASLDDL